MSDDVLIARSTDKPDKEMDKDKILICFADTGGGHKAAALATKHALDEIAQKFKNSKKLETKIESVVGETNKVNSMFVALYNYLLCKHQDWMKYYIGFIEIVKPDQRRLAYLFCKAFLIKLIGAASPSVIVSVHPMTNHYIAWALKDLGLAHKTKFVVVVTDPNGVLWSGWACPDATLTIAPNDLARNRLIELGLNPLLVKTVGMPVDPIFLTEPPEDRNQTLSALGLDPKLSTILLTAGWAGGGMITGLYQALQKVQNPIQIVVLCGRNESLELELKKMASESTIPTTILPFSDSMPALMNACDLLITKAGGLTTFEAIARHLPMALDLLTEPMPQEAGTVDILLEAKLAKPLSQFEDIIPIAEALKPILHRDLEILPSEHNLNKVDAIYDIAKMILELCYSDLSLERDKISKVA